MGNIGDTFSTAVPSVGSSGTAYASSVNSILTEVMTRLSTRIPMSSIAPATSALDMNGQAVQNASELGLYASTGLPAGAPFGRLARYAGNLYYVDASGAVQITSGAAINAAGVGGIVGDYGGVNPAKVSFVDGSETYEFYDDMSLTQWAILKARRLDVVHEASGFSVRITPPVLTATYDLTLPVAPPATGQSLLAMVSTGVMQKAESGDVAQFKIVGADVKHDDATYWQIPSKSPENTDLNVVAGTPSVGSYGIISDNDIYTVDIRVDAPAVGKRLKAVAARIEMTGTGTNTCTVSIYKVDDGVLVAIGTPGSTTVVAAPQTVTATATDTVVAGRSYVVRVAFTTTGVVTLDKIYAIGITADYV